MVEDTFSSVELAGFKHKKLEEVGFGFRVKQKYIFPISTTTMNAGEWIVNTGGFLIAYNSIDRGD